MTPNQFIDGYLKKVIAEVANVQNRILPIKGGAIAKAHFQDNFRKGGFVNNGLQKWQPKKKQNGYKTLLSKRNNLFSSIQSIPGIGEVRIINSLPYAAVHNEGLRAGRGKGFTMPKRQFIGESKELTDKINTLIETELTKVLKP